MDQIKQAERLRKKIADIKRKLAAEKKKFGCYDDSGGKRYRPLKYFIQLGDYAGGLAYLKWFTKNFPDDSGFPVFLFEWTIILFKSGKIKDAERKAFQTFCANTYMFDKFFARPIAPVDKLEGSNWEGPSILGSFDYNSEQTDLADFADWLGKFISSEPFVGLSGKYIDICRRLNTEDDIETRGYLIKHARQLKASL
jgi:hypothetical protein